MIHPPRPPPMSSPSIEAKESKESSESKEVELPEIVDPVRPNDKSSYTNWIDKTLPSARNILQEYLHTKLRPKSYVDWLDSDSSGSSSSSSAVTIAGTLSSETFMTCKSECIEYSPPLTREKVDRLIHHLKRLQQQDASVELTNVSVTYTTRVTDYSWIITVEMRYPMKEGKIQGLGLEVAPRPFEPGGLQPHEMAYLTELMKRRGYVFNGPTIPRLQLTLNKRE